METWKPVIGYENLYEVSDKGRIKSMERIIKTKNGVKKKKKECIITPLPSKITQRHPTAHYHFELWKDGKRSVMMVHRAVAMAFIQNPLNKPQITHIDGNPANNCIENLEWVTNSENMIHAYKNSLIKPKGTRKIKGFNKIEELFFDSTADATRYFNTSPSNIGHALNKHGRSKTACGYEWEFI